MSEHPNLAAALVVAVRETFNPYADRGRSIEVRLKNRYVVTPSGCWIWISTINATGYGMVKVNGAHRAAHRVSYELRFGSVPDGLVLDHLCMVKACVNPDHLEPVTQAENVRRCNEALGIKQYASHCPSGHDLAIHGRICSQGYRRCRACERPASRGRYLRRSAA